MVRGRSLAAARAALVAAIIGLAPVAAHAGVLDLVRRICLDEKLPYGDGPKRLENGDTVVDLAPGHPEYDRSLPLLPRAPAGWTEEAPQVRVFSSGAIGCGFRVGRAYKRGEKTLGFGLLFMAAVKDIREDLAKPKPDVTPPERLFEFKGRKGYDRTKTPDRDLLLIVGNAMLIVDGTASEDELRALLDATDLEAIDAFRL